MSNKCIIGFVFYILSTTLFAQQFSALGPGFSGTVKTLYFDKQSNLLYAGGFFNQLFSGEHMNLVSKWDGNEWDTLNNGIYGIGPVSSIAKYDDKIFVGGMINFVNGNNYRGLIYWDGNEWGSIGDVMLKSTGTLIKMLEMDEELYVLGMFDSITGNSFSRIAKWNGTTWSGFPQMDSTYKYGKVECAAIYKGQLYIGGNFKIGTTSRFAKFDGTSWNKINVCYDWIEPYVNDMIVYKNELYIGGRFRKEYGAPGNGIIKWNGDSLMQVDSLGIDGFIYDMQIVDEKLFVCGQFESAGGLSVSNSAIWDGSHWSGIGATFDGGIYSMASNGNDIFFGGSFKFVNGIETNGIVKYSLPLEVNELEKEQMDLILYPNPVLDKLKISGFTFIHKKYTVSISNIVGSSSLTFSVTPNANEYLIELPSYITPGTYYISVISDEEVKTGKFIKL